MKKFAIAAHGNLAQGMQSTLELFVGKDIDITYMSAYMEDGPSIELQIDSFLSTVKSEDEVVIFTDLFGGSVNQKITLAANGKKNIKIIAGFNVPVILEVIFGAENYTQEGIQSLIENGRQAMQQVNTVQLKNKDCDEIQEKKIVEIENCLEKDRKEEALTTLKYTTLRVDERLIHGQIAMVWSRELDLDGIIVANDEAAKDETQQMALKMAVPSGINVLIRSVEDVITLLKDSRAQNKKLLVLVRTIKDASRIADKIETIGYINIGNVGKSVNEKKETLTQFVMLTQSEYDYLVKLTDIYPETALQNLPSDKKEFACHFIEKKGVK